MTESNSAILEVVDLTKHFSVRRGPFGLNAGLVKAVEGVSFRIGQGLTLALVGESGCGKTTTARMILKLETATSGVVKVDGEDIDQLRGADLKRFRSRVQAVFQDPWSSLNPRVRVRDLIAEPLVVNERLRAREVDRRVAEALENVGLRPEQAQNFPHEFSGGQRQRIAIASALISKPRLIVLDEPVSALDVSIRSQIMNLFKDLQAEHQVSYLLVAHDLATTRYLADDVAVMYLGSVVEAGPSEVVFEAPKHPYTQALFSAALPGRPEEHQDEIILHGEVPSPLDPPSGCPFHPRCHRKIGPICEHEVPVEVELTGKQRVSCHLYTT